MLEKTITNKILKFLKAQPNCFAWKTHGDIYSQSGIPDIICCIGGKFVAFEVLLIQKSFIKDHLSKKQIKNTGELP